MGTALAERAATGPTPSTLDATTLERVVCDGDLSRLNPTQKVAWYRARCEAAGLDVRTQPFQYLNLKGKLVLYATKAATDQLIASRSLTVEVPERRHAPELGVYEARCRVTFPDGRHVEDIAAVTITDLEGENLCNALMKCVTKAKRRTVLSACGLGMLDESEVETIPGAQAVAAEAVEHIAEEIQREPPRERDSRPYFQFLADGVAAVNSEWLAEQPDAREAVSAYQANRHMLKAAIESNMIAERDLPHEPLKDGQVTKILSGVYGTTEGRQWARREITAYLRLKLDKARRKAALEAQGDPEELPDEPGMRG